jgi:hypothetical protein
MLYDTLSHKNTFVFNGKRIITGDGDKWGNSDLFPIHSSAYNFPYLNLMEDNGYAFYYKKIEGKATNYYVNYRGKTDGPFDDFSFGNTRWETLFNEKGYDYYYQLAGRWYGHKDGKNKMVENQYNKYVTKKNDYYAVSIKDRLHENYDGIYSFTMNSKGNFAFLYYKNHEKHIYISINDIIINKEIFCYDLVLTESDKYAFTYSESDKYYANINGQPIQKGYDYIAQWSLNLTENGKYAFIYKENGKYYANINGQTIQKGYDYIVEWSLNLTESGKYAFVFKEKGKYYANINGLPTQKGYGLIENLKIFNDGTYSFKYYDKNKNDGKIYENNNGTEKETNYRLSMYWYSRFDYFSSNLYYVNGAYHIFENNGYLIFNSNKEHSFSSSYEYEYVVIDGKRYGDATALQGWYDKKKNAFIWNAIEGRELVVYEYKPD